MATTTNLSITLPAVGGDNNTWGTVNNNAINAFDAIFSASGTSVSLNVGTGKTLTLAGTLAAGSAASVALPAAATAGGATIATISGTQTLTNKTLSAPVFAGAPSGTFASGVWSPSWSGTSCTVSGTTPDCFYIRVGNYVFVTGHVLLTAYTNTFSVSGGLPVSSDLAGNDDACGAVSFESTHSGAFMRADATTDKIVLTVAGSGINSGSYRVGFSGAYKVL